MKSKFKYINGEANNAMNQTTQVKIEQIVKAIVIFLFTLIEIPPIEALYHLDISYMRLLEEKKQPNSF
jgi:hypothetical protein